MSRLVEKVNLPVYGEIYVACVEDASMETMQALQEPLKKLYEYEQEDEQGRIIHVPCKLGETLFSILYERGRDEIIEVEVKEISIGYYLLKKLITIKAENKMRRGLMYQFQEDDFGVILFRFREEAEKKLREMEEL